MSLSNTARSTMHRPSASRVVATVAIATAALNAEPALARQGRIPLWTLEPDLRYDDSAAPLTRVNGIAVDRSGRIFVAQPRERAIKVFGTDGTLLEVRGRDGEGPGEFRAVSNMLSLGDSIWVNDYDLRRGTIFRPDGSVARITTFFRPLAGQRYGWAYPLGTRFLVVPAIGAVEAAEREVVTIPLLLLDAQGFVRDTLAALASRRAFVRIDTPGGGRTYAPHPTPSRDHVDVVPGGRDAVIARGEVGPESDGRFVEVAKIGAYGDTLFVKRIHIDAAPVEDDYIERKLEAASRGLTGRFPSADAARRAMLSAWGDLPAQFSPVNDLFVDNNARIWIRTTPLENRWIVLNPAGTPLARVRAPAELEVLAAADNSVWGVRLDEFDVPSVLRFRIRMRPAR